MSSKRKWDFSTVSAEAAKYSSRNEFSDQSGSAYNKALQEKWLDEVCSHMQPVKNKPRSFSDVCKEAKKYKYRAEFKQKAPGYYQRARRQGWLDDVCRHMEVRDDGRLHCVYGIINERLKSAYIGITRQNFDRRIADHKGSSNKTASKKIIHETDTVVIRLTEYIYSGEEVRTFAEQSFIDQFEDQGFQILNDYIRIGSLGYSDPIWTFSALTNEISKYDSRAAFARGNPSAYRAARNHARRLEIFSKLDLQRVYWDAETVKLIAAKFQARSKFKEAYPTAYLYARRNKILDAVCAHMGPTTESWDLEKVTKVAADFDSKSKFRRAFSGAVKWAEREGLWELVAAHMPNKHRSWSDEELAREALKFDTKTAFHKYASSAYATASRRKILAHICGHMKPKGS